MSNRRKQEIAHSSAEWFVHKMPPWVSEERRAMWIEMITDCVLAALAVFEEELAEAPRLIRLFCPHCMGWLRAKEKHAGLEMACPKCGKPVKIGVGSN